jgi:hypothetical protein
MNKILSFGVILLFIGVALAPTIDGDSDFKLIEDINEDCGCCESIDWDFPFICDFLRLIFILIYYLYTITEIDILISPLSIIDAIAVELGCWNP